MVHANDDFLDRAEEEGFDHALVAVRYVGKSPSFADPSAVNQGRYPVRTAFNAGTWYVALIPESTPDADAGTGVAWFERSSEFEVEYGPEKIAEYLLGKNYLPSDVFGDSPDGRVRDKVIDFLGLEDEVEAGQTYEEQLRELAGVENSPATESVPREEELLGEYDRAELKDATKSARDGPDDFGLRGKSTEDMAQYLAGQNDDEVDAALKEA